MSADKHYGHPTAGQLTRNLFIIAILMIATIAAYKINVGHMLFPGNGLMETLFNNTLAISIALVKAYFVVSIFMAVKFSTPVTKIWALCGFVWLPFITMLMGDYTTRHWEGNQGWVKGSTDVAPLRSEIDESWKELNKEHAHSAEHE